MMHKILFRAKRIYIDSFFTFREEIEGKWVEGYFIKQITDKEEFYIVEPKTNYDWVGSGLAADFEYVQIKYAVDPNTVGQYSGKDDDNGEKLFEGDIVKGLFLHGNSVLSVVTFKDGAFGLEWNRGTVKTFSAFASICNVTYEKIGNIFDNPELLKEGETE